MISYLILCSLLIPVNLWAAITPHMHSDVSMRILHGASTLLLLPLLITLWNDRRQLRAIPTIVLGIFAIVMVVVNSWITAMGMGGESLAGARCWLQRHSAVPFSCSSPRRSEAHPTADQPTADHPTAEERN